MINLSKDTVIPEYFQIHKSKNRNSIKIQIILTG